MLLIRSQRFYERETGAPHDVEVFFGGISPVSNGRYEIKVDGELHAATSGWQAAVDGILTDIIRERGWSPVNAKGA